VARAEPAAHANEPVRGLAARDRFIAARVTAAALPLRVRREAKQKPVLGVERDLDGWAWVIAEVVPSVPRSVCLFVAG
jgi:hypothetical protein